jgi:hypothetical protein
MRRLVRHSFSLQLLFSSLVVPASHYSHPPSRCRNECLFIVSDKTGVIIAVAYGGGGDDDVNRR